MQEEDQGEYICAATNPAGEDRASAMLIIFGKKHFATLLCRDTQVCICFKVGRQHMHYMLDDVKSFLETVKLTQDYSQSCSIALLLECGQ